MGGKMGYYWAHRVDFEEIFTQICMWGLRDVAISVNMLVFLSKREVVCLCADMSPVISCRSVIGGS